MDFIKNIINKIKKFLGITSEEEIKRLDVGQQNYIANNIAQNIQDEITQKSNTRMGNVTQKSNNSMDEITQKSNNSIDQITQKNNSYNLNEIQPQYVIPQDYKYAKFNEFEEIKKMDFLDIAIEQYLYGLLDRKQKDKGFDSYSVLNRMGINENQPQQYNAVNEEKYISYLKNTNKKYIVQKDYEGNPAYYHINPKKRNKNETQYKLYLNIERKNVAYLAYILSSKYLANDNAYFKFIADNKLNDPRAESFVFYVGGEDELNRVVSHIEQARQEKPHLFLNSERGNEFLKSYNGYIKYIEDIDYDNEVYKKLDGTISNKGKMSYNLMLSKALEDSFVTSMKKSKNDYSNNVPFGNYVRNDLEDILKDGIKKKEFIADFRKNLIKTKINNPKLDIKGITLKEWNEAKNEMLHKNTNENER